MTIPDINTSNVVLGNINLYQVSNMIRDNNKIFDCKLNEIRKEYDLKFDKINNKKWKLFKIIYFI
jgi:hypothetical protein